MSEQTRKIGMLDANGRPHRHQNGWHLESSPRDPEYPYAYCDDCGTRVYFEEADW